MMFTHTRNNGNFVICTNSQTPRFRNTYSNHVSLLFTKMGFMFFHRSRKRTKLQHSFKSAFRDFTKTRTCISSQNSQLQCFQKSIQITILHFTKKWKLYIWHFSKMHEFATFLKLLFCKFTKQHELLKFGNTTYARFWNIYIKHKLVISQTV